MEKQPKNGHNDPLATGTLALSRTDDFFFGNGNLEGDGGPLVIERYNGGLWTFVAGRQRRLRPDARRIAAGSCTRAAIRARTSSG